TNRPRVRRRLQVADVLARCLHPDPFARPHDGDEMYQLLSPAGEYEDVDWRHPQWHPARRQLAATDAAESEEELETIAPDRPVNAATEQHSSPMPTAPPPPSPPPPIERLVVQPRPASDVTVARSRRMSRRARRVLLVLVGAAVGVFIGLVLSSHLGGSSSLTVNDQRFVRVRSVGHGHAAEYLAVPRRIVQRPGR